MSERADRVRSVYEAFARGDVPAFLAALDPAVEWSEAEHVTFDPGHPYHGPDEVLQGVLAPVAETFGDTFRVTMGRLYECGDTVIVEARYTGTAQATGRPLDAQVLHLWEVQGDRITRFQQYTDTWQFAEVTGVAPIRPLAGTATA